MLVVFEDSEPGGEGSVLKIWAAVELRSISIVNTFLM